MNINATITSSIDEVICELDRTKHEPTHMLLSQDTQQENLAYCCDARDCVFKKIYNDRFECTYLQKYKLM